MEDDSREREPELEVGPTRQKLLGGVSDVPQIGVAGEEDGGPRFERGHGPVEAELMELACRVTHELVVAVVLVHELPYEIDARGVEGVRRIEHQHPPTGRAVQRVIAD